MISQIGILIAKVLYSYNPSIFEYTRFRGWDQPEYILWYTFPMSEDRVFAEGQAGVLVIPKDEPGIIYKNYKSKNSRTSTPEKRKDELTIHQALLTASINTMPVYEIDEANLRIRMTDLSNVGKNLVATTVDHYRLLDRIEENNDLQKMVDNRPFYNIDDFLQQLKLMLQQAIKHRIFLKDRSFGFVITPQGDAQTYIVDYEDAVNLNPPFHDFALAQGQMIQAAAYLNHVVRKFFPRFNKKLDRFIEDELKPSLFS